MKMKQPSLQLKFPLGSLLPPLSPPLDDSHEPVPLPPLSVSTKAPKKQKRRLVLALPLGSRFHDEASAQSAPVSSVGGEEVEENKLETSVQVDGVVEVGGDLNRVEEQHNHNNLNLPSSAASNVNFSGRTSPNPRIPGNHYFTDMHNYAKRGPTVRNEQNVKERVQTINANSTDSKPNAAQCARDLPVSSSANTLSKRKTKICFKCEVDGCVAEFPNELHMQLHYKNAHPTLASKAKFRCHSCDAAFFNCASLASHSRTHDTFICVSCGKVFPQLGRLKQHQRVHSGERPYGCSKCDKVFANSSHLSKPDATWGPCEAKVEGSLVVFLEQAW